MSSRKGGGRGYHGAGSGNGSSSKGKVISGSGSDGNVEQLSRGVADVRIDPAEEGDWEVYARKPRNRGGANAGKALGSSNNAPRSRGQPEKSKGAGDGGGYNQSGSNWAQAADPTKQGGRGNPTSSARSWEAAYMAPAAASPAIAPPLQHGWQWAARSGSSAQQKPSANEKYKGSMLPEHAPQRGSVGRYDIDDETADQQVEDILGDDEDELIEDSDFSDDYDSDVSQKSLEARKKSSWFKSFFEILDKLTVEQINETSRQWHCPACSKGPGAIDWYKGLQPLATHAKTKGASRVKLHRDFAELLEEELQRRGTSIIPAGEVFGKWKGLRETTTDREIVWPPMVVVMNTILDQDDNERWVGMGNQELLEYFQDYAAQKAKHSYGPRGHRGMSILIFDASAVGFLEAERLHKHFAEQGTDREAWERKTKVLFYPGGKRQLYGFLACKEYLDVFNQHCQAKTKLKFEMISYQEKVVSEMRQMNEDNQQLTYFRNQVAKHQLHKKTLEESFGVMSQKLRETMEENRTVRERTTEHCKENKLEMDYQEKFFKEQIDKVHKAKHSERLLQEERAKAKQTEVKTGAKEEHRLRQGEIAKFIDSQVETEEFEAAREELMRIHEGKKADMRRRHLEEEVELEKEFDSGLTKLMEKHAPSTFESFN